MWRLFTEHTPYSSPKLTINGRQGKEGWTLAH